MNEKELLDMMVTERIQILVQEMKSARTTAERETARLLMDHAEGILKPLSEQEHAVIEQYLDSPIRNRLCTPVDSMTASGL